jgi:hypothetical protein
VQALSCGATRIATVQLSHTIGGTVFTWLGESQGHHTLSHAGDADTAGVASFVNCERWFAEQFAYLLSRLNDLDLLDHTVVLWAKELGDGRMHQCADVPWVLAGNANGFFNTGRYLTVDAPHDAILTSIVNALGVADSTFGRGTAGPLEALR